MAKAIERVAVIKHGSAVNELKNVVGLSDDKTAAIHDSVIPYTQEFLDAFSEKRLLLIGRKYSYNEFE